MKIMGRKLNPKYIASRSFLYTILALMINAGFALLVTAGSLLFLNVPYINQLWIMGTCIFIMALLFTPMRRFLEKNVDSIFFKSQRAYHDYLLNFSSEIANSTKIDSIIHLLFAYIKKYLYPENIHIFLLDQSNDVYIATKTPEGDITTDIQFHTDSPLVQYITSQKGSFQLNTLENLPEKLSVDTHRLQILGSTFFSPLRGSQRLTGWVAISKTVSGENYQSSDVFFLESLCSQASVAIERILVIANLEKRVREMDVLSRISEGVNITITLDDILELIYAQTTRVLPADDFHIQLIDKETNSLFYIFYVEQNDRDNNSENRYFSGENTLELDVINTQKSIITNDYVKEYQKKGIIENVPEIKSWLCVPLNSGAETIGSLSLGSRKSDVIYSTEQLKLLEAIADQAAGAIVKSRLLAESERRAQQFITLNEVSRQLTATFESEKLLQSILDNAIKIINCEAGSLLLVDEETDELVFSVTAGPVAAELYNKRLPAGVGVVGKSVKTRQPVIVNNIQSTQDWYSQTDKQTGYKTEGLLVIPLAFQENVIGAIEVLNKKDKSPFSKDDQVLLEAFSAQAAVAITNARLYNLTDQELNSRVEELSIMQRIDRELNSRLDMKSSMGITLEWALRQSGAQAGFVGAVRDSAIHIIADQGYTDELDSLPDRTFSIERLQDYADGFLDGQSQNLQNTTDISFLKNAKNLTLIPIQRENKTNGIILLERISEDYLSEDITNFLIRLSDHASTAISNAELYAAVQAANIAKSEFVSFVSHELKNPMTSIKGYTELLAAGAVGPITEAQSNFLMTIKTNVERMATLVSDLADISRIEAGRLRLDFKAVQLQDILEEVIRSRQHQLDEKKQKVTLSLPPDLPNIWADRIRVVQILTNLISNANKYTPNDGTIQISCEISENTWDPTGASVVAHVTVTDDGIGINEEDQKKIFQKFFRSEDNKAREAPGTGLGLNITMQLVEKQGGKIWFESAYRKGTTFHFTLPIAATSNELMKS